MGFGAGGGRSSLSAQPLRLRLHAQRNLKERQDPRLADWLKEDLRRLKGRVNLLTEIGSANPACTKVILDFWEELQPFDTLEKQRLRNFLAWELTKPNGRLDKALLPIALRALETPGKEMHALRYAGMEILARIESKPTPELRRVLLAALLDVSDEIREMAV